MAEPATDIFGGMDIDRVVRGAMPQPMVDVPKAASGVAKAAAAETEAKEPVYNRIQADLVADKAAVHRAHDGIEPVDIRKWDADTERQKYSTDIFSAFGSPAFIATMLASAFTKTPMINALNAGGAALGAIKEKDDQSYDRAYEAFKTNADLAIKRHTIQRQAYDDAIKLLNTDRDSGLAELQMLTSKFGDEKSKALLQGGYIKELVDYQTSMNTAYRSMAAMMPKIEEQFMRRQLLQLDPDYQSEDPARKTAALRRVTEGRLDPQQQIFDQWVKEHPDSNAEERAGFFKDLKTIKPQSPEQIALNRFLEENPDATSDQIRDFTRTMAKGGVGGANRSVENKGVEEIIAKDKAKGIETTVAEAKKRFREETASLPEGEKNKIRQRIDAFDNSSDKIDTSLALLDRTIGSAGIAGRATRLAERVGNIFGTNSTDREQFMRDIQYLRLAGARLLTESAGRPLAAEAARINDIIGGLNLGDTTANTIRALEEVKQLYAKMRADNIARLKGTWAPRGESPAGPPAPPPASGSSPWLNDPVVK